MKTDMKKKLLSSSEREQVDDFLHQALFPKNITLPGYGPVANCSFREIKSEKNLKKFQYKVSKLMYSNLAFSVVGGLK